MEEQTPSPPMMCLTCKEPTEYTYLCPHCSELFLVALLDESRKLGIKC